MSEVKPKRRFGVKRWIILALIGLGIYAAFIGPSILKPITPQVSLAAENTGLHIGGFQITNTMLATLLADVILILMAMGVYRFIRSGKLVPSGFYNAFEAIFEFMWNSRRRQCWEMGKTDLPDPGNDISAHFRCQYGQAGSRF